MACGMYFGIAHDFYPGRRRGLQQAGHEVRAPTGGRRMHAQGGEARIQKTFHQGQCDAVVGNSSSGIIEVPSFGKPTVNIGDRQKGRVRAASVIDCRPEASSIRDAIRKALSPRFQRACRKVKNPYGKGGAARAALGRIRKVLRGPIDLKKDFRDVKG